MSKIDKVILRETAYIAVWTLIFSTLLQSVFLMIGLWDVAVLLGNVYSAVIVVLNFFLMGLSIQKAMTKEEEDVKTFMKASSTVRMLGLFLLILVGALLPCFSTWTVVIPLLFPRVAITLRPLFGKMMGDGDVPASSAASAEDDGKNVSDDTEEAEAAEGENTVKYGGNADE